MTYQSDKQPLCRYCSKPIKKATVTYYAGDGVTHENLRMRRFRGPCRSKDECQKLVEEQVVSVSWSGGGESRYIWRFSTWDGKSYEDEFFCKGGCAQALGYLLATEGHCTRRYKEAAAKRDEVVDVVARLRERAE